MHAARLSESIIIRRKASTRDPLTGAEAPGWVNDAPIWAEARPLRSREFVAQAQAESEIEVVFTIHYQEDITADSRIIWRGDLPPVRVDFIETPRGHSETLRQNGSVEIVRKPFHFGDLPPSEPVGFQNSDVPE